MNIRQALEGLDGSNVAALAYSPGYTAYASEDAEPGVYFVTFCRGEMPPHKTERFADDDAAVAYLEAEGLADGWELEEAE